MFASSREVYGNTDKGVLKEDNAEINNCESPYSASKILGETLVRAYQKCYGINFVLFRFSNVYGMYDESNRVVPLFIRMAKENKDLVVFGKEKMLDFTYIDDTIDGIIKSIENFDKLKNDVFNIAYGEGTTILKVAELIKEKLNPDLKIHIQDNRTGEVVKYTADISKFQQKTGYVPTINIEEGINKSIEWYEKNIE